MGGHNVGRYLHALGDDFNQIEGPMSLDTISFYALIVLQPRY